MAHKIVAFGDWVTNEPTVYGRLWMLPPSGQQQRQGELYGAVRFDGAYRNGDVHPVLVETNVTEALDVHFLPPTEISFRVSPEHADGGRLKAHPEAQRQTELVGAFTLHFTEQGGFLRDLWHTWLAR